MLPFNTLTPTQVQPSPLPPSPSTPSPLPPSPTPSITPTATINPTPSPLHFQVFDEIWTTVRDNYLYPDFNGLNWDRVYDEYFSKIESGLNNHLFYTSMYEMINLLGDDHSTFFSPEEAKQYDEGYQGEYDYAGIGVFSTVIPEKEHITIVSTFPNSPAEEAGLQIHDSILEVDGHPIFDEQGYRFDLLRGPEGTQVELTVQSPGEAPRNVSLIRRRIEGVYPIPHNVLNSEAGKKIGYLIIPTFQDRNIDEQVRNALADMSADEPLDGLIIDNRQNRGGASDVFNNTLSYFTDGELGHFINRNNERSLFVEGEDVFGSQNYPLVLLVGPNTISFGEIFSGVLKDIGRAYLIGEQTDGNVEILYVYDFSDGSRAWIAEETFRPLNNPSQNWEITGIVPDLVAISSWDEVTLASDPAVQASLEYFDQH
jgi:C-terminal peptidase prc